MGSGVVRLVTSQLLVAAFLLLASLLAFSFLVFCSCQRRPFNMRPFNFSLQIPLQIRNTNSKWQNQTSPVSARKTTQNRILLSSALPHLCAYNLYRRLRESTMNTTNRTYLLPSSILQPTPRLCVSARFVLSAVPKQDEPISAPQREWNGEWDWIRARRQSSAFKS